MSTLETILARAMSEPEFAEALFTNAEAALAEYNLPANEIAKFKGMSRAQFEALTTEERKSFGVIVDQRGGWDGNHNQTALSVCK